MLNRTIILDLKLYLLFIPDLINLEYSMQINDIKIKVRLIKLLMLPLKKLLI